MNELGSTSGERTVPGDNLVSLQSSLNGHFLIGDNLLAHKRRWYAIQTRSRFEETVVAQLTARAVETYFPSFEEIHQWKDRKRVVKMAAFPGYVFARFAEDSDSRVHILQARGAVRIVGHGGGIEPIPDSDIDSVRLLLGHKGRCFSNPFLREGTWVRVHRGPLKNLEGLFIRFKNSCRIVVSIELVSQSVAAEVDASDVEAVGRTANRPDHVDDQPGRLGLPAEGNRAGDWSRAT
jgi:transcriptional antiterminator NusG